MPPKPIRKPPQVKEQLRQSMKDMLERSRKGETLLRVGAYVLPQPEAAGRIIDLARQILFHGYVGRQDLDESNLDSHVLKLTEELFALLSDQIARSFRHACKKEHAVCDQCRARGEAEATELIRKLPEIRKWLEDDVKAGFTGDPAATGYDEIIFSYPGLYAITVHRIAHELYKQKVPLLPRLLSEAAHSATGIDIHPGAQIGRSFFIDHGTGVVIGQTTVIGDHVKMYQGATLGALSFPRDACGALIRDTKRHPTIEDNVTIYAGATILGGDTVIGAGSTIGGSVWLTHSVPPGTKVLIEQPRLRFRNSSATVKDEGAADFQI